MIIFAGILLMVQLGIFEALPERMKVFFIKHPLPAAVLNMGFSYLILEFAGVANLIGMANLLSSVIFALILMVRKKLYYS